MQKCPECGDEMELVDWETGHWFCNSCGCGIFIEEKYNKNEV